MKELYEGKVKFYNKDRGYGFIIENTTLKEVFFHFSATWDRVVKDDEVLYELAEGEKGIKAVNVRRNKKAQSAKIEDNGKKENR